MAIEKLTLEETEHRNKLVTNWLPTGQTIYSLIRHVSANGMTRSVSLFIWDSDSKRLQNITHLTSKLLNRSVSDYHGHWVIKVRGCGFDAGFDLIQSLSYVVHGYPKDNRTPEGYQSGYTFRQEEI